MNINILEAHDRFKYATQDRDGISKMCETIIAQEPFGKVPFYIFAHARTIDDEERLLLYEKSLLDWSKVPNKRIIWQPRLTRPYPQENSMLFRVKPRSDSIEICWIIPDKALWDQYEKGKVTENHLVWESIQKFKSGSKELTQPHPQDISEEKATSIYKNLLKK